LCAESTVEQKALFERWNRANFLSLMMMKQSIFEAFIGTLPKTDNAKDLFVAIGKYTRKSF
jgi:hypothetical protein